MRGKKNNATQRITGTPDAALPDDFPASLRGEFEQLPEQLVSNLGTICGLTTRGGGYFGFSVTDDGGACKLAIRTTSLSLERRLYSLVQLEAMLAYLLGKLADG